LTSLHLGWKFNQELDLRLVPNLTSLHLGFRFNQELNLTRIPNLTSLRLGNDFDQPIRVRNGVTMTYSYRSQRNFVTFY